MKSTGRALATGVVLAACAGLLSACAETTLAVHTVKSIGDGSTGTGPKGSYKIGNPYQISGTWYYPKEEYDYREEGAASWYGPGFNGKLTANGETYDQNDMTAAHRTLPLPSMVRVTNLENGRSLVLRINDRGPFAKNRIIDISKRGAELLGFAGQGTARVRVEVMAEESLALKRATISNQPEDMPVITAAPRASVQAASLDSAPPPQPLAQQAPPQQTPVSIIHTPMASMPPPAAPSVSRAGGMFVQAGAFSSAENVRRLETQLGTLAPVIVTPIDVNGQKLLRVRLGPLASDADAERILAAVQAQGLPGARVIRD
jgi:rare lipoprotein A